MALDNKQRTIAATVVSAVAAAASLYYLLYKKGAGASRAGDGANGKAASATHKHASGAGGEASGAGIRPVSSIVKKGYTREQLAQYDGVKNERIFMSVKMKVYEVAPHFYGPGQHYHVFAGTEASRALAKADLTGKYLNQYWVNCSEEELEVLEEYVEKFNSKYPIVGWYVPDDQFYKVTE